MLKAPSLPLSPEPRPLMVACLYFPCFAVNISPCRFISALLSPSQLLVWFLGRGHFRRWHLPSVGFGVIQFSSSAAAAAAAFAAFAALACLHERDVCPFLKQY